MSLGWRCHSKEAFFPNKFGRHHSPACRDPPPTMSSAGRQMPMSAEQMQAEQMKQKQQEEMRGSILQQVLQPEARERLSRISIVKPEKARAIEDMVIQMAQRGQLATKIDENKLIELLERAGESEEKQRTKVTVKRRTYFSDEDEDDDDDF